MTSSSPDRSGIDDAVRAGHAPSDLGHGWPTKVDRRVPDHQFRAAVPSKLEPVALGASQQVAIDVRADEGRIEHDRRNIDGEAHPAVLLRFEMTVLVAARRQRYDLCS